MRSLRVEAEGGVNTAAGVCALHRAIWLSSRANYAHKARKFDRACCGMREGEAGPLERRLASLRQVKAVELGGSQGKQRWVL